MYRYFVWRQSRLYARPRSLFGYEIICLFLLSRPITVLRLNKRIIFEQFVTPAIGLTGRGRSSELIGYSALCVSLPVVVGGPMR